MKKIRVRYMSDLHTEFWGQMETSEFRSVGEDLVVLAGDIGIGLQGVLWALRCFGDRPVVYIFGNHEFYGYDWTQIVNEAKAITYGTQLHVLECDETEISGLRILGCSLWTDFDLYGEHARAGLLQYAIAYMEDYDEIRNEGRGLIPIETRERCLQHYAWLKQKLQESAQPTLVVTHHAPSLKTANPLHEGETSNACFHSNFDELIRPPCVAWIHGHTHHSTRVEIGGVPLVTNQRGYPDEGEKGFSWGRVLDIKV